MQPNKFFLTLCIVFGLMSESVLAIEIGTPDDGIYGNTELVSNPGRDHLDEFDQNAPAKLALIVSAFDIDDPDEVQVMVNGRSIGYLSKTASGKWGKSRLLVPARIQRSSNTLVFRNRGRNEPWAIRNITLLRFDGPAVPLAVDSVDRQGYGHRYGTRQHAGRVQFSLPPSSEPLDLKIRGFNILASQEVEVRLNRKRIGYLPPGRSNRLTSAFRLRLAASDLPAGSTLDLIHRKKLGGKWGVARIALTRIQAPSCSDDPARSRQLGVTALPAGVDASFVQNYCKYTELVAPNGRPIQFFGQTEITDEQMVRARNILAFYLEDVPGSVYGNNKRAVFNSMANNEAKMILLNGSDDGDPPTDGQTLYQTENVLEGSQAYASGFPRDAAFEEILHLMHDTGIGVDGPNTMPGVPALVPFQNQIRAATENAIAPGVLVNSSAAQLGLWAPNESDWLTELSQENSLTQEYLASVVDTYYGLAGKATEGGFNDLYQPQTRGQIRTQDPGGWSLLGSDSPRLFFSQYVTYDARIDAAFTGTFYMKRESGIDYTHKSRYLTDATLTGSNSSSITGNNRVNRLSGNRGDNELTGNGGDDILNGLDGTDTAVFSGPLSRYEIMTSGGTTTVSDSLSDGDGSDQLTNIELMRFSDQTIGL